MGVNDADVDFSSAIGALLAAARGSGIDDEVIDAILVRHMSDPEAHGIGREGSTVCHHCGHSWDYGGTMEMATCPSCSRKTSVS